MATALVHLPEVERLSTAVIRILGGNPGKFTLQGTNTYLVGTGPRRLLIDTGEGRPSWSQALRTVLSDEFATVSCVILTHWHHDHVGGVAQLHQLCPDAKIYKNRPDEGQLDMADGQRFTVDGATLRAFHTPGHTVDHTTLIFEDEDAMFTGDNVLGHGTAVFEDLATYLDSLHRMQHQFGGRAYPGHGAVIDNGPRKIREYITHRAEREQQVIEALSASSKNLSPDNLAEWTSMELVRVIYKDVPENLHVPAERGLIQVLQKLEAEGKVARSTDTHKWRIQGRAAL